MDGPIYGLGLGLIIIIIIIIRAFVRRTMSASELNLRLPVRLFFAFGPINPKWKVI